MNDLNRDGRLGTAAPHIADTRATSRALTRVTAPADPAARDEDIAPANRRARTLVNTLFVALWLGGLCAYLWGYFGPSLFGNDDVRLWLSVAAAAIVPILLVAVATEIIIQGRALVHASRDITRITRRLSEPEGPALQRVAIVTNAVRRELDILSGSLDATLDRVAAVESLIENQVSAIERAGGRAQVRAQVISDLLSKERDGLSAIADDMTANAARAAETIQSQAARVSDANREATHSIMQAEASLTRQLQAFQRLTEDHARNALTTVHDVETVAERLRSLSSASLESTRGLTASIDSQHETLAQTTHKLDHESQRLANVFEHQGALIARIESAAQSLGAQLETVLGTATARVDGMFETLNSRTSAAGDALRAETEAALVAGSNVASAIETVAAKARATSTTLRETIAAQIDAFNTALSEGLRSLDSAASATGETLSQARHEASGFAQSLDDTVRGIETAGERLNVVLAGIGDRSEATRETLDDASRALAYHMAEVPDLAAEHASRISALLEDQASRMAALAQALGGRAGTAIPAQAPQQTASPSEGPVSSPAAAPFERAPKAAAASIIPLATAPSTPPEDDEDTAHRAQNAAPVPFTPAPLDQRSGLAAFGRIGRRLRQAAAIGSGARGRPAAMDVHSEPETQTPPADDVFADSHSRAHEAVAHATGPGQIAQPQISQPQISQPMTAAGSLDAGSAQPAAGGFWSALFARIEGEDGSAFVVPKGATLAEPSETLEGSARRAQHTLETLYAIAIDLDRLLEEEPPIDLWKRYRAGEADVFARRLLTLRGGGLVQRIRHKYRDDLEFREHADRYRARFEENPALGDTPAGRLNALLSEALSATSN